MASSGKYQYQVMCNISTPEITPHALIFFHQKIRFKSRSVCAPSYSRVPDPQKSFSFGCTVNVRMIMKSIHTKAIWRVLAGSTPSRNAEKVTVVHSRKRKHSTKQFWSSKKCNCCMICAKTWACYNWQHI